MVFFRKNALKKITSAEELDKTIVVVNPVSWLIVFVISIFAIIFLLWSIFARISTYVQAPGIFLPYDGLIVDITAQQGGTLQNIFVNVGDIIEKDGLVAELSAQDIDRRISYASRKLALEQKLYDNISSNMSVRTKERNTIDQDQISRIEGNIQFLTVELQSKEAQLKREQEAFKNHDITQATLSNTRNAYLQLRQQLNNLLSKKEESQYREIQSSQQDDIQLEKIRQNIQTLTDSEDELKKSLKESKVYSPIFGRVIEIKSLKGANVTANQVIMNIVSSQSKYYARAEKNIEFISYVSVASGKKIDVGTEVNVAVDGYNKNDYGFIKGVVTKVSSFPVSASSVLSKLGNRRLVDYFTKNGPVYEVVVKLLQSPASENRLLWSNDKGMSIKNVNIGTLGNAEFVLKKVRPINKAIPALKDLL